MKKTGSGLFINRTVPIVLWLMLAISVLPGSLRSLAVILLGLWVVLFEVAM